MGLDPFQPAAGRTDGGAEEGPEMRGDASGVTEDQCSMGDEDDDGDEADDGDDTDDSEVWEPSRSVRKSLSVSED